MPKFVDSIEIECQSRDIPYGHWWNHPRVSAVSADQKKVAENHGQHEYLSSGWEVFNYITLHFHQGSRHTSAILRFNDKKNRSCDEGLRLAKEKVVKYRFQETFHPLAPFLKVYWREIIERALNYFVWQRSLKYCMWQRSHPFAS